MRTTSLTWATTVQKATMDSCFSLIWAYQHGVVYLTGSSLLTHCRSLCDRLNHRSHSFYIGAESTLAAQFTYKLYHADQPKLGRNSCPWLLSALQLNQYGPAFSSCFQIKDCHTTSLQIPDSPWIVLLILILSGPGFSRVPGPGGRGGGFRKCPRPITVKLFMMLIWNLLG